MLDAACAGQIFTSPTPDQMLEAHQRRRLGRRRLHIVKNYTGDVMNFEMAAELAAAETGSLSTLSLSMTTSRSKTRSIRPGGAGRSHGIVEKLVGAAAEEGRSLIDLGPWPGK